MTYVLYGGREGALRTIRPPAEVDRFETRIGDSPGVQREQPARDVVDAVLESRLQFFKVVLVGTQIHVSIARKLPWTRDYTDRALTEAGALAALGQIYAGRITVAAARQVYQRLLDARTLKYSPKTEHESTEDSSHLATIDVAILTDASTALNLTPLAMVERWRLQIGEAKLIESVLRGLGRAETLSVFFSAQDLAAYKLSVPLIRMLLTRRLESLVELARHHPAAKPWREAFARNGALQRAEREPNLADFGNVTPVEWARPALLLTAAIRKGLREQLARTIAESLRQGRNDHLRPHALAVDNAAEFTLKMYEPLHTERLPPMGWEVHGGQQLTNIKDEPIYLLRVESDRVFFQNAKDQKFYEQTLEGFAQEQLYSIYALAGEKAKGAIVLGKWVLGVLGAIFPLVRYGVLAADVINSAHRLQSNHQQLELLYDSVRVAYGNIDKLLPGVLPKVWDAVLDKRNVLLFNPLQNPDVGAWLKAIVRVVMMRQANIAKASYVGDAVSAFLNKSWGAIGKGLDVLMAVIQYAKPLTSAVLRSTGVSEQRAFDLAIRRLQELGVVDALLIGGQTLKVVSGDLDRLSREIKDLIENATRLMKLIKQSLEW
jgi:hypothetical protein